MDACAVGVVFLAPAFLLAETTYISAEALTNVHGRATTPLSAINLQTISDISVDLLRQIERYVFHRRHEAGGKMDDPEAIARSRAAAALIRQEHQASQKKWNFVIILIGVSVVLAFALSGGGSSSSSSFSDVQYKVAAKALIKQRLRDPSSAEFSSLEVYRVPGRATVVCGLVSSRNGFGGMTGPQRFISGDQVLLEEAMPAGQMDQEWLRSC